MVLSLRHGNRLLALTDECFKQWMESARESNSLSDREAGQLPKLVQKVKHAETGQISGNQRFVAKGAEGGHIKRLNSLRNEFIHFTPERLEPRSRWLAPDLSRRIAAHLVPGMGNPQRLLAF